MVVNVPTIKAISGRIAWAIRISPWGRKFKTQDMRWKCGRGAMHTIGEGGLSWDKEKLRTLYQCNGICPLEAIKFWKRGIKWAVNDAGSCGWCERVCSRGRIVPKDDTRFMRALSRRLPRLCLSKFNWEGIYVNLSRKFAWIATVCYSGTYP